MKRNKHIFLRAAVALLAAVMLFPAECSALGSNLYKKNSVLASGKWVRVKVSETGMQEIPFDDLRKAGFSDPEKVTVFGFGGIGDRLGSLSSENMYMDDLTQIYSETFGDKLVFFGESGNKYEWNGNKVVAVFENFDSTDGYYFLTDSRKRIVPGTIGYDPAVKTADGGLPRAVARIHPLAENLTGRGARLSAPNLMSGSGDTSPKTVTLTLPGYAEGTEVCLCLDLVGGGNGVNCSPKVTAAGTSHTFTLGSSMERYVDMVSNTSAFRTIGVDRFDRTSGNAEIDVVFIPDNNMSVLTYESIAAGYRTSSSLLGKGCRTLQYCEVNAGHRMILDEPSENVRIWNISGTGVTRPVEIYTDPQTGARMFGPDENYQSAKTFRIALFDPARTLNRAEIAGEVPNQNIHGEEIPGMVIVASPDLADEARRLAEAHLQYDGMKTLVVTPRQVYNEFSSGTPSANAIRRMLKMFYDRDTKHSVFRYLLLLGPAAYDQRLRLPKFRSLNHDMLVPTYPTHERNLQISESKAHSSDYFFSMLGDGTGYGTFSFIPKTAETDRFKIAVGRIPAISGTQARNYIDKAIRHLRGEHSFSTATRAALLCDDGDSDTHVSDAENIAALLAREAPYITPGKIYNGFYPWTGRKAVTAISALTSALREGVCYMTYSGHGRPDALTAEDLISKSLIKESDWQVPPVMFFATCKVFAFDSLDDNFCQDLLFQPGSGAVALIASCRDVYQQYNQTLNMNFAEELFGSGGKTAVGDAFLRAMNSIIAGKDLNAIYNSLCYNFGGDPAIPAVIPDAEAVIESINGKNPAETDFCALEGGRKNRIAISFPELSGDSFNGTATVRIYESPRLMKNLYQDNPSENGRKLKTVSDGREILLDRQIPVVGGKAEADIYIPLPARPGETNRIVVTAVSDNGTAHAIAFADNITVKGNDGTEPAESDTEAPVIENFRFGPETFVTGDVVPSSGTVSATISDNLSGIVVRGSAPGTAPRLILDGNRTYTGVPDRITFSEEGDAILEYPLGDLEDGPHTLRLEVRDYAGNIATSEISFTTVENSAQALLGVSEEIARKEITFTLSHTIPGGEPSGRLIIEKSDGTPAFTRPETSFPFTLTLRNPEGENILPDGRYRAKAYIRTSTHYKETTPVEFYILNER